jgi:hypothetical protein
MNIAKIEELIGRWRNTQKVQEEIEAEIAATLGGSPISIVTNETRGNENGSKPARKVVGKYRVKTPGITMRILQFFANNPQRSFKAQEVREAMDLYPHTNSLCSNLTREGRLNKLGDRYQHKAKKEVRA